MKKFFITLVASIIIAGLATTSNAEAFEFLWGRDAYTRSIAERLVSKETLAEWEAKARLKDIDTADGKMREDFVTLGEQVRKLDGAIATNDALMKKAVRDVEQVYQRQQQGLPIRDVRGRTLSEQEIAQFFEESAEVLEAMAETARAQTEARQNLQNRIRELHGALARATSHKATAEAHLAGSTRHRMTDATDKAVTAIRHLEAQRTGWTPSSPVSIRPDTRIERSSEELRQHGSNIAEGILDRFR